MNDKCIFHQDLILIAILLQSDQFQDDIFPDTPAPTPAITGPEWMSGVNRLPVLISLKTGQLRDLKCYYRNL